MDRANVTEFDDASRHCTFKEPEWLGSVLSYVAQFDACLSASQSRTGDVTQYEKENIAHSLLHKSPYLFLVKYGQTLTQNHLQYFRQTYEDDADIVYQLRLIQTERDKWHIRTKNRRYAAMKQLMAQGDYFSEESMKSRDPFLYHQVIGQFLTGEEVMAQANAIMNKHSGLSSILLSQIDSNENQKKFNREIDDQDARREEFDSDDEGEGDESMPETEGGEMPSAEIKLSLREDFLRTMQERFLSGSDRDFDYSTVDANEMYDDLKVEERDAEEKYFDSNSDSENPQERHDADSVEYDY